MSENQHASATLQSDLVRITALTKTYPAGRTITGRVRDHVHALSGIDLTIVGRTTVGLVGESGSGKSTVARLLMGLTSPDSGSIVFDGHELVGMRHGDRSSLRRDVQMVFQDPFSSFDPLETIGGSLQEPLRAHTSLDRGARERRVSELLDLVGLSAGVADRYPREVSGGQLQRAAIGRALAVEPKLLVLDEAVSSLDLSTRAQIINLLEDLQRELHVTYLFIAHDLAVVRHMSDWLAVMYLGRVVEQGPTEEVYESPRHPYTQALLSAIPMPNPKLQGQRRVTVLDGEIPSPINPPTGCRFNTRCSHVMPVCKEVDPSAVRVSDRVTAACHLLDLHMPSS